MSKQSNVNPDQYTQAGRDRPGDDLLQEQHKQQFTQNEMTIKSDDANGKPNFIPGAAPVGESDTERMEPEEGSKENNK
jgi:hypothetical protein